MAGAGMNVRRGSSQPEWKIALVLAAGVAEPQKGWMQRPLHDKEPCTFLKLPDMCLYEHSIQTLQE